MSFSRVKEYQLGVEKRCFGVLVALLFWATILPFKRWCHSCNWIKYFLTVELPRQSKITIIVLYLTMPSLQFLQRGTFQDEFFIHGRKRSQLCLLSTIGISDLRRLPPKSITHMVFSPKQCNISRGLITVKYDRWLLLWELNGPTGSRIRAGF